MAVHPSSTRPIGAPTPPDSDQEFLRRSEVTIYRCFLPDLAGFIALCRAGPGPQRHAVQVEANRPFL